jgi:transketolase N-terminal domain/subunit
LKRNAADGLFTKPSLLENKNLTRQSPKLTINTIRTLSIDAIQKAKSGHPGTPMALAPLVYTLWNRVMHFDPKDPIWPNRDRFILSNGHASMLLWSILHLTGTQAVDAEYENLGKPSVSLDDIRRFRTRGRYHECGDLSESGLAGARLRRPG